MRTDRQTPWVGSKASLGWHSPSLGFWVPGAWENEEECDSNDHWTATEVTEEKGSHRCCKPLTPPVHCEQGPQGGEVLDLAGDN